MFPVGDWQFWVVTAVAGFAAFWLVWKLSAPLRTKRRRTKTTLTIHGQPTPPTRTRPKEH